MSTLGILPDSIHSSELTDIALPTKLHIVDNIFFAQTSRARCGTTAAWIRSHGLIYRIPACRPDANTVSLRTTMACKQVPLNNGFRDEAASLLALWN